MTSRAAAAGAVAAIISCLGLWEGPVHAQTLPARIELIVGFAPGGGDGQGGASRGQGVMSLRPQPRYDLIGRLYVRHLHRFLPPRTEVVLRHMPGSGSLQAALWLARDAPPNGGHLAMVSGYALREMVIRGQAARVAAFAAIGAIEAGEYVCASRTGQSLKNHEAVFGTTAPGERSFLHARAYATLSNQPLRLVSGYANTAQLALAFRRREVDGFCGLSIATVRSQLGEAMANGALAPLVRFAPPGAGALSQVPRASDLPQAMAQPAVRKSLQLLEIQGNYDWALLGPPGLAAGQLDALRNAYRVMTGDPAFRAEAVRWGLSVDPVSGTSVQQALGLLANAEKSQLQMIGDWSRPAKK